MGAKSGIRVMSYRCMLSKRNADGNEGCHSRSRGIWVDRWSYSVEPAVFGNQTKKYTGAEAAFSINPFVRRHWNGARDYDYNAPGQSIAAVTQRERSTIGFGVREPLVLRDPKGRFRRDLDIRAPPCVGPLLLPIAVD